MIYITSIVYNVIKRFYICMAGHIAMHIGKCNGIVSMLI